jgi:hypothetical protein
VEEEVGEGGREDEVLQQVVVGGVVAEQGLVQQQTPWVGAPHWADLRDADLGLLYRSQQRMPQRRGRCD